MTTTTLKPTVYGVGINDVPGSWNKPYYKHWSKMMNRCYSSKWHAAKPTYIGCTVDPRWHHLSDFKRWYEQQDNVKGKQLDKDIISPGNKVYGPDTCLFVSQALNSFFLKRDNARGPYLIGVSFNKWHQKFESRVSDNVSKRKLYLGFFNTELEAHQAWMKKKKELFNQYFIIEMDDNDPLKPYMLSVYNHFEEYFV